MVNAVLLGLQQSHDVGLEEEGVLALILGRKLAAFCMTRRRNVVILYGGIQLAGNRPLFLEGHAVRNLIAFLSKFNIFS